MPASIMRPSVSTLQLAQLVPWSMVQMIWVCRSCGLNSSKICFMEVIGKDGTIVYVYGTIFGSIESSFGYFVTTCGSASMTLLLMVRRFWLMAAIKFAYVF